MIVTAAMKQTAQAQTTTYKLSKEYAATVKNEEKLKKYLNERQSGRKTR